MNSVTAAVMTSDRVDSRLPHILDRLAPLRPMVIRDGGNPWKTARSAWAAAGAEATHHLVVQDDLRIAAVLPAVIDQLVRAFPDTGFAFYAQWDTNSAYRVRMAALGGEHLVETSAREWVPAQALLLPRRFCAALAALPDDSDRDDDEVLAAVLYRAAVPCRVALTVPNLVEHDDDPAVGYNSADGLRRAACYVDDAAEWSGRPDATWDGQGWEEIGLALSPLGARVDFGIHVPEQPRRMRQIHVPWRLASHHVGLPAARLADIAAAVVADTGGWPGGGPEAMTPEAMVLEYAVAGVLHGIAWRHWWRGGRLVDALRGGAVADAALGSLWRSGGATGVPDEAALALGWSAVRAGAELTGLASMPACRASLVEWFHAAKASLPPTVWGNVEHGDAESRVR